MIDRERMKQEALREIAEHAATRDVDVCLEMHGDFYRWEPTLKAVELADHPRVGIVHNCDPREMKLGPIALVVNCVFREPMVVSVPDVRP